MVAAVVDNVDVHRRGLRLERDGELNEPAGARSDEAGRRLMEPRAGLSAVRVHHCPPGKAIIG